MSVSLSRQRAVTPLGTVAGGLLAVGLAYAVSGSQPAPIDMLALVGGAIVLGVSFCRPDLGLLFLVGLTMLFSREVLFERGLPGLGGQVKVTDALLLAIVGGWLLRRELGLTTRRLPERHVMLAMALFFLAVVVAIWTARGRGTPLEDSLKELRPLLAYLLVLPVVAEMRSLDHMRRGLWILLGLGAVASLLNISQYLTALGPASTDGELTRVLNDAFLGPMVAVVAAGALYAYSRTSRERLALGAVAAMGLAGMFVTFQRGAWVAAVLALAIIVALLAPRYRRRLGTALAVGITAAALAGTAIGAIQGTGGANPLEQAVDRARSIGDFETDMSAQHRFAEWREAVDQIREQPAQGIGLGSGIVFYSPLWLVRTDIITGFETSYIHSTYVWFPLKLGLPGAAAFFAMFLLALRSGVRAFRTATRPESRPLLLTALGCLTALAFLSLTGPHLNYDRSSTIAAVAVGVLLAVPRLERT